MALTELQLDEVKRLRREKASEYEVGMLQALRFGTTDPDEQRLIDAALDKQGIRR